MFNKKICKKCGEKISNKFDFCPYCGFSTGSPNEDWGMLGKNDQFNNQDFFTNSMFGGFSGKVLQKMLNNTMKMLEKEMGNVQQDKEIPLKTNFELFINGKRISPRNIKVTKKQVDQVPSKKIKNSSEFSQENIKKFSELPKQEPLANVRRLSNKVIYEIDVPGVKSLKDISIIKLENSIEIKAVAKDKAYKKLIPVDLPLNKYKLDKEKIVLELNAN